MAEDFTTMNNPRFLYLAEMSHSLPDWVAEEETPKKGDFQKLASTAFADPWRRLLPIATKTATFHSALNIFAHPEDFDDEVFETVKKACEFHEIVDDVAPYVSVFAGELSKQATAEEPSTGRFAIDTEIGGAHYQLLPLNDAEDVRGSAADLAKMANEKRLHFVQFVGAAQEIVKAAADHGVTNLPTLIKRFGVARVPNAEKAARMIEKRADQFVGDKEQLEVFNEHYKQAAALSADDPESAMEKIAAVDQAAGVPVSLRADAPRPTPYEIVYCGETQEEIDKAAAAHVLVRDIPVPLEAVRGIDETEASFKLSKEAADQLRAAREGDRPGPLLTHFVGCWTEQDQKTFLRLAADAAA